MIIYYDSYCRLCSNAKLIWRKIDRGGRLQFASFRDWDDYPQAMEAKLHVYNNHKWFTGFNAILAISKQLPLLWGLVPILHVCKWSGLGEALYRIIAKNRTLVPVNHCTNHNCRIDR